MVQKLITQCIRMPRELAVSLTEPGRIVVSFIELFYAAPVVTISLFVQFAFMSLL